MSPTKQYFYKAKRIDDIQNHFSERKIAANCYKSEQLTSPKSV